MGRHDDVVHVVRSVAFCLGRFVFLALVLLASRHASRNLPSDAFADGVGERFRRGQGAVGGIQEPGPRPDGTHLFDLEAELVNGLLEQQLWDVDCIS